MINGIDTCMYMVNCMYIHGTFVMCVFNVEGKCLFETHTEKWQYAHPKRKFKICKGNQILWPHLSLLRTNNVRYDKRERKPKDNVF
jgi:hypothetical protein